MASSLSPSSSTTKNPHLTEPILTPFTTPTFSPIDYLNANLPSAAPSSSKTHQPQQQLPSISSLATQTQSHISTLNAQTTRLSDTLTSLTDDILRTGSRLAYEVEVLRGETITLAETLSSTGPLNDSIKKFVPNGLDEPVSPPTAPKTPSEGTQIPKDADKHKDQKEGPSTSAQQNPTTELPQIPSLRTLQHIRHLLTTTTQIFNAALSFPLPPSHLTTPTSSLITVTSPNADPAAEEKGQAALARLKGEVTDLLQAGEMDKARERVGQLRELCGVWKGTGEEKARVRFVEGLEGLVEMEVRRREEVGRRAEGGGGGGGRREQSVAGKSAAETAANSSSGPGFLRRLREEIYME